MSEKFQERRGWLRAYRWFLLTEGLLAAVIFYIDLSLELGIAGGVLYVVLVFIALWARKKRFIWIMAVLGTILTIVGFWLSPPGGELWKVASNRILALLIIWGAAFFCYVFRLKEADLEEAHEKLEVQYGDMAKKDTELELVNRQLEETVEKRTQKLQATNLILEREVKLNLQAKKEIENTLTLLQTIMTAAGVGIYGLDLEGRTTFCNPSGAAMIGYSIEEMVGKKQHDLIHHTRPDGSFYPKEECLIYSAYKYGATYRVSDEVFWRKNGSSFPVEYISSPLYEGEAIVGAVVTFKDVSAQKLIEGERLALLSSLEGMNVELKDFAHVVSHDLKEPLRGITFNAKWLVQDYEKILGDEGKNLLSQLCQNAERMHHLINGLLKYAEVSNIEELSVPLQSGHLVEMVVRYLQHNEDVEIEIEQPLPELVYPPIQLEQVFQNLIVNSIKHSAKQKAKVVVSCRDLDQYWCFRIWDNGRGIQEQHFDRIFHIFQSLDKSNAPESTGVGLALVKKIVEQNGGKISVDSKFGEFTCFSFTVPKKV